MDMTQFFPVMLAGFAAAVGFTPITKRLAVVLGVLDQPSARKVHQNPTPLMGGLAIYGALVLALLLFSPPFYLVELGAILAGATWLVLVGFVDDRRGMQPLVKLGGQTIAAIVLVLAGIQVRIFPSQALNVTFTLLWIVGIINAMNFQDNMDGLAAGITAIASITFFVMAVQQELSLVGSMAAALGGASIGFLIYNFNPASSFMGDMGSMVLGFLLAVLAIKLDFRVPAERQVVTWMVPVVVLGLPIFDTVLVTLTRLIEGRSPMVGGKDHTSHRLVSLGLSQRAAVLALYAVCAALGFAAVQLSHASISEGATIGAGLAVAAAVAFVFLNWAYLRNRRRA
ncbi:MAG: MraY family glycosyltransferase [Chloroflexota bacterium]|jgi:UDP-GlcNAc:undecaprenyl-phosphate GlcNAc-1-phosphate transferase|nr:undecaprenyl/decaprenyl-phosphate alpha-N-acetylglucosaminyl 1-phosphate transferase [Anaerolineae bacterium]HMM27527.1 MraY family glycosyltransferase [Aggregatilineaceae bacterium]